MAILIVEDDEMLRTALVALFERRGYRVLHAGTGNGAIRILESGVAIDLIICDFYMPDGDGKTVLDFVRRRDPDKPPFILITGQTDLRINPKSEGIAEFLIKPVSPRDLLEIVRRYVPGA